MNALFRWILDRTGADDLATRCRDHKIPGKACWCDVWPAAIVFAFAVQAITGLFLWMYYSPGAQNAWESVYYIQHEVAGGWLLRGVHHFAAQVLVALSACYVIQMIVRGNYRVPREFVFWAAVSIGLVSLAMCLTGDLLAWDQNSYWATQVRVKFLTLLPVVGSDLYKLAAGGPTFGHLTLTRFFAFHAGLFAPILAVLLCLHGRVLRRADTVEVDASESGQSKRFDWYWPNQAVRNAAACLVVVVIVGLLVMQNAFSGDHAGQSPGEYLGMELGAPADPADAYAPARPEWSLLGVYELSNMFPGDPIPGLGISWKVVPIFVLPTILLMLVFAMPILGLVSGGRGHKFNLVVTFGLLIAIVVLSIRVVWHDRANEAHQAALAAGHEQARRVVELARAPDGIPVSGALTLLRNDPKIQGPTLFKQHCASCHDHVGADAGLSIEAEESSAPNLFAFASEPWIEGLLDSKQIAGPDYFGNTALENGSMAGFVQGSLKELVDDIGEEDFQKMIAALAEEAKYDAARPAEAIDEETGFLFEDFTCTDCHKFHDTGKLGGAPDLTGYGSRKWLVGIVSDPTHRRFYASGNDRMPAYAKDPTEPANNILSTREVEMLADWLRGTWYGSAQK